MARTAAARRPAPRVGDPPRVATPRPATSRAGRSQASRTPAVRTRATRLFFIFVVCLAALAVGRVALSFAVVQKSLQTDAVKAQLQRVEAENGDLAAQVTRLGSSTRIRRIAETQLGLVPADRPIYLRVAAPAKRTAAVAER